MNANKLSAPSDIKFDERIMELSFECNDAKRHWVGVLNDRDWRIVPGRNIDRKPVGGRITIDLLSLPHELGYASGTYSIHLQSISPDANKNSDIVSIKFTLTEGQACCANAQLALNKFTHLEEEFEKLTGLVELHPAILEDIKRFQTILQTGKNDLDSLVEKFKSGIGDMANKKAECECLIDEINKESRAVLAKITESSNAAIAPHIETLKRLEESLAAQTARVNASQLRLGGMICSLDEREKAKLDEFQRAVQTALFEIWDEGNENTADHQAAIRDFKEKSTKVLEDLSRSFWLQLAECKHGLGKTLSKEISQAALLRAECGLLVVKQRAEIEALENARVGAQELIGQLQQKLKELEVLEMARKKAAASAKEPAPRPRRTEARLTRFKALWMMYWIKTSGGLKAARNTFLEGMSTVGVVMWRLRRIAVVTLIVLLVGHFVVAPIISGTCRWASNICAHRAAKPVRVSAINTAPPVVPVARSTVNQPSPTVVMVTNTLVIEKTERVVENQPVGDGLPRIPITTCWSRPFLLPDPNVKVVDFYGDVMEDSVMYDVLINGRNVYYNCRRGNPPIVNEQIFSIQWRVSPYSPRATGTIRYFEIPHQGNLVCC